MKYFLTLSLTLFIFTAVASGLLAYVNNITKDKIAANKLMTEEQARIEVLPGVEKFEKQAITLPAEDTVPNPLKKQKEKGPSEFVYYKGFSQAGELLGYTFISSQYGYSSVVRTMVGVDTVFCIVKIKVIEQAETPGLGANSTSAGFQQCFEKKSLDALKVDKDGGEIVSLTGATITSRAITGSIAAGIRTIKVAIGGEVTK